MAASLEELKKRLDGVEKLLDSVESQIGNVKDMVENAANHTLTPLDRAKGQVSLAYCMETLFYRMNLKLFFHLILLVKLHMEGTIPSTHHIYKDLERVKNYVCKIKETEQTREGTKRVNANAASRFIRNALWEATSRKVPSPANNQT